MAPSTGSVHPVRYLTVFAVLVAVLYALVFFTGDKSATPKLGIDLQGGTRVTLTARTPDGSKPTPDSLRQAQEIIETRVNGLGVSGSEVVIDGDNLVITVPGDDSAQARSLGQTARLYVRPVQTSQAAAAPGAQAPAGETPAEPTGTLDPGPAPAPQNRPFPAQDPSAPAEPTPSDEAAPADGSGSETAEAADEIAAARASRQSTDPAVQQAAMATLDCSVPDPLRETTIRRCPWWRAPPTVKRCTCSRRRLSTGRRSPTPRPATTPSSRGTR